MASSSPTTTAASAAQSPSSVHNFSGTVVLAICALSLSAAVYLSNRRRVVPEGKGNTTATGGGDTSLNNDDREGEVSSSARPTAPRLKSYYTMLAERHVRRHQRGLVAWFDNCLGVALPYSPIMFKLVEERRQAPLVLLTLQYLRQEDHQVVVTLEELPGKISDVDYRDASMAKITDCCEVLKVESVPLKNTTRASAEYRYVDEHDKLINVLSFFVTHERLAVTLQYSVTGPTRARSVVPTAFYEMVRGVEFSPPQQSPSYLLVSEPRLGMGFRLPLDYNVYDGLCEGGGGGGADSTNGATAAASRLCVHGLAATAGPPCERGEEFFTPFAVAVGRGSRRMAVIAAYEPSAAVFASRNKTAANVSIDHSASTAVGVGRAYGASWKFFVEGQLRCTIRRLGVDIGGPLKLLFRGENVGGGNQKGDDTKMAVPPGCLILRPYMMRIDTGGNFHADDGVDSSTAPAARATVGSCCIEEVTLEHGSVAEHVLRNSPVDDGPSRRAYCGIFLIPLRGDECISFTFLAVAHTHSFESFATACAAVLKHVTLGNHYGQGTSVAYCCQRLEMSPFTVTLTPGVDAVEEPMLGDPVAIVRRQNPPHGCSSGGGEASDVGSVPPTSYGGGAGHTTVMLRVFPVIKPPESLVTGTNSPALPSGPIVTALAASNSNNNTAAMATGASSNSGRSPMYKPHDNTRNARYRARVKQRLLKHTVRTHISKLAETAQLCEWRALTVNAMPAVALSLETVSPLHSPTVSAAVVAGSHDNMDSCSCGEGTATSAAGCHPLPADLESEVGTMNPFSRCPRSPPPPPSYLGLSPTPAVVVAPLVGPRSSLGGPPSTTAHPPSFSGRHFSSGGGQWAPKATLLQAAEGGRGTNANGPVADAGATVDVKNNNPGLEDSVGGSGISPHRSAVVVLSESSLGFLFITDSQCPSLGTTQQAVRELASQLTMLANRC